MELYAVLDTQDLFILFVGTEDECFQFQEESYGGLAVLNLEDSLAHIATNSPASKA